MAWSDAARAAAAAARRAHGTHRKQIQTAKHVRRQFEKVTGDFTNNSEVRAEVSAGMRNVRRRFPRISRVAAYTKALRSYTKRFR